MANLLEVHKELAKKYSQTIDKASFQYIDRVIDLLRERNEDPAEYELILTSNRHVDDPFTTNWSLKIRKMGERKLVD